MKAPHVSKNGRCFYLTLVKEITTLTLPPAVLPECNLHAEFLHILRKNENVEKCLGVIGHNSG